MLISFVQFHIGIIMWLTFLGGFPYFFQFLIYRKTSNYVVVKKVGRGKYSDCYRGYCTRNGRECCIKVLKPVKMKKIKRYEVIKPF